MIAIKQAPGHALTGERLVGTQFGLYLGSNALGEIVDALIVREPGTAVELFDLGVFENRYTVLVSSGHGWSLFLRGHGTHLFVHRADADPEAARHVLDANFGGL